MDTATSQAIGGALRLVCTKCCRYEDFPAENQSMAKFEAQKKGWKLKMDLDSDVGVLVCPRCVKKFGG